MEIAFFGKIKCFDGGGSGSHQHKGFLLLSPDESHLSRVVSGCGIRFVAGVTFFIHDNKAQVPHRSENSATGSYNDIDLLIPYFFPIVKFFFFLYLAVNDRDTFRTKGLEEFIDDLFG